MGTQETRENIISAAIDLFWQKSYHGVNMNALSQEAGVNKATVYQHFASKEALAVAAVNRSNELSIEYAYTSTFEGTNDPKQRIIGIYHKVYQMQKTFFDSEGKSRGCPFVSLGLEMATTSDIIRKAVANFMDALRPYYARIIDAHWQKNPPKTKEDKDMMVTALIANMNGALVAAKLENRPEAVLEGQTRALKILNM